MGEYVRVYVREHARYWDLYLTMALVLYILLMGYTAWMWGIGEYYSEATGLPIISDTSLYMRPIIVSSALLSPLFLFTNIKVIGMQQIKDKVKYTLLLILYQVLSFLYLVLMGYILYVVISTYLIGVPTR